MMCLTTFLVSDNNQEVVGKFTVSVPVMFRGYPYHVTDPTMHLSTGNPHDMLVPCVPLREGGEVPQAESYFSRNVMACDRL